MVEKVAKGHPWSCSEQSPYRLPFGGRVASTQACVLDDSNVGTPVLHHCYTGHVPSATAGWVSSIEMSDPITSVVLRKFMQDVLDDR